MDNIDWFEICNKKDVEIERLHREVATICLLYTSDAADE